MSKVVVVGGGAAGMFASIFAADNFNEVVLIEQNEKLGKKLFITGKGRCNITNACDMDNLFSSVLTNSKFLYSAFNGFNNYDVIDFFENNGLETKVERGGRVFPKSDHSSDVIKTLLNCINKRGVKVLLNTKVESLLSNDQAVSGVTLDNGQIIDADCVIVATGGYSYQSTGSTGDGYRFAKDLGHNVTKLTPALVPFNVKEEYVKELQGLSLKNIEISIFDKDGARLYSEFGEMLFTHFGISGPVVLTASSFVGDKLEIEKTLDLKLDLKPALTFEQLDKRVLREFDGAKNKQFKNSINSLFPSKLIPVMIRLSGIEPEKKINEISKEERENFVRLIKELPMTIIGLRGFNEAIITKGGVDIKEINPKTMESKKVKGLYFVGEVLDLNGVTGGFNLQIAWSSAYAAASSIY